jgi:hypothetical protein
MVTKIGVRFSPFGVDDVGTKKSESYGYGVISKRY